MKKVFVVLAVFFLLGVCFVHAQNSKTLDDLRLEADRLCGDYFSGKITLDEFGDRFTAIGKQIQPLIRQMEQTSPSFSISQINRIEELMEKSKSFEAQYNNQWMSDEAYEYLALPVKKELDLLTALYKGSPQAENQLAAAGELIGGRWPGAKPGWPPAAGIDSVEELCGLGPFFQSRGTRASYSIGKHSVFDPVSIFNIYQTNADIGVFRDLRNQVEAATGKTMRYFGDSTYSVNIVSVFGSDVYFELYFHRDIVCLNIGLGRKPE